MPVFEFDDYFPYSRCYPGQKAIMQEIYTALVTEKIYLLEGACGTGKTLSALIPAISAAKDHKKLVVIATNVNEQKAQFITEAQKIREKAEINIIAMSSKLKICYHNNISKKEDEEETDYSACQKMRDAGLCEPYNRVKGIKDKEEGVQLGISFEKWVFRAVRTPAELITWGIDHTACAYSLVWKVLSLADVVICDLTIVLNKRFMLIFELFTGKSLNDIIIVFDEAHNIEKVAKGVYEKHISEQRLSKGIGELDTILDKMNERRRSLKTGTMFSAQIEEAVKREFGLDERQLKISQTFIKTVLLDSLVSIKLSEGDIQNAKYSYGGSEIGIADPDKPYFDRPDELTQKIMAHGDKPYILERLDHLATFGQQYEIIQKNENQDDAPEHISASSCTSIAEFFREFLDIPTKNGYFPYLSLKKNKWGVIVRRVNIHLSLPEIITAPVLNEMYAGVLMSATLEPFDSLKKVLGISRETITRTVGLQFPPHNRRTYVVTRDARNDDLAGAQQKYAPDRLVSANDKNPASIKYIQDSIESVIDGSNQNVLIFFKTKDQALQYYSRLKGKYGQRLLLNEASPSSGDVKNTFYGMGHDGKRGILCTYLGGSLTEGVDFRDDRARTVVVVGIGYTNRNMLVKADETAYEVKFEKESAWDYVVQIPTIRRIRQALGRVIRSDMDYGIRILLDARYAKNTSQSVFKLFPPEERREFVEVKTQYLKDIVSKDFKSFEPLNFHI